MTYSKLRSWPCGPGTYMLILEIPSPVHITIGRRGRFLFPAAWYAYVGSAQGPGGLHARLSRHCRTEKRPHWHIDYLLPHALLHEVWYAKGTQRQECAWAAHLGEKDGTSTPVPGFGASDCRCPAHLFVFESYESLTTPDRTPTEVRKVRVLSPSVPAPVDIQRR